MRLTQQIVINYIANYLSQRIKPETFAKVEALAEIYPTLTATPHVNELRGINFGHVVDERIVDFDEAMESAEDQQRSFSKYVVDETQNCYLELIKLNGMHPLKAYPLQERIRELAEEYRALGYRPLDIKVRVPIDPTSDAHEFIAEYVQNDRDMEPYVDVTHERNSFGSYVDIFLPNDKEMLANIIDMLGNVKGVWKGLTVETISPLIPGYKSTADCIARIEGRKALMRELSEENNGMRP